jgi:hypothetical protein
MKKEDIISLLGDGNPGGETVIRRLIDRSRLGNGMVLWMKEDRMMGARLWCLYKYFCDMNIDMTYSMLKTLQHSQNPRGVHFWNTRERSVRGVIEFLEGMGT